MKNLNKNLIILQIQFKLIRHVDFETVTTSVEKMEFFTLLHYVFFAMRINYLETLKVLTWTVRGFET